jgi:hypothetical protein
VNADAVIDLIGLCLRTGELPTSGGVKPHMIVHVPVQTMAPTAGDDGDDLDGGDGGDGGDGAASARRSQPGRGRYDSDLAAEVVRRLGCDADFTRLIIDPDGQPLDVGRTTRDWTVAQRRAIEARDGGCRFPVAPGVGCGRPVGWCDAHHIVWWRHEGRTAVDNGALLCRRHHWAVHHDRWKMSPNPADGVVTITRTEADGTTTTRTSPPAQPLSQPRLTTEAPPPRPPR